jgi:hypothetical protein
MRWLALLSLVALAFVEAAIPTMVQPSFSSISGFSLLGSSNASQLYQAEGTGKQCSHQPRKAQQPKHEVLTSVQTQATWSRPL